MMVCTKDGLSGLIYHETFSSWVKVEDLKSSLKKLKDDLCFCAKCELDDEMHQCNFCETCSLIFGGKLYE